MNRTMLFTTVMMIAVSAVCVSAQRPRYGKICGNPNLKCVGTEDFQPWELTFGIPKNAVIYESELFYAVILKSVKLKNPDDCTSAIAETDRLATQALFPNNKIFAMNCFEAGGMAYSNTSDNSAFMAVYAGKTLTEANAFLKNVKATGKFSGANLRRMRATINGT